MRYAASVVYVLDVRSSRHYGDIGVDTSAASVVSMGSIASMVLVASVTSG